MKAAALANDRLVDYRPLRVTDKTNSLEEPLQLIERGEDARLGVQKMNRALMQSLAGELADAESLHQLFVVHA
jgi:hypothetical protein